MTCDALINLADKILSLAPQSPEALESIAAYAEAFAEWSAVTKIEKLPQDTLSELSEKHAKVIRLARGLQLETASELKSLQSRAKGILTYADYLPRRISMGINRKG